MIKTRAKRLWAAMKQKAPFAGKEEGAGKKSWKRILSALVVLLLVIWVVLGIYWSMEPGDQNVVQLAQESVESQGQ